MADFSLPPISDAGISVPSFSTEELASLPSTTLISLSNNMAALKTEVSTKAAQLKARTQKLTGEASIHIPGKGRNSIASTVSINKVKSSMESTIGPSASTANLMTSVNNQGDDIISNPTEAGTTQEDASAAATKISSLNLEIL